MVRHKGRIVQGTPNTFLRRELGCSAGDKLAILHAGFNKGMMLRYAVRDSDFLLQCSSPNEPFGLYLHCFSA